MPWPRKAACLRASPKFEHTVPRTRAETSPAALEKRQTLVYRQPEIAGLERLDDFGRRLYQPAIQEVLYRVA